MNINSSVLKYEEKVIFKLRELYRRYGYIQYKMSKFEEYDLYVRNKSFLISDNIITFTDTNGKLMALKPDVTLSIVKNSKDLEDSVQKVFYDENVYRVSKGTQSFKENMQVGLECIGDIDTYCLYEALMLAAKSLYSVSEECVLDISHLGIVTELIRMLNVSDETAEAVIKCIGEKNVHELTQLCEKNHIEADKAELIKALIETYGKPSETIPKIKELLNGVVDTAPIDELSEVIEALDDDLKDIIHIDFSVVNDIDFYNGIVFKGFIKGVPGSILTGGQYDSLMKKMNRSAKAIGFAVYLDMLERFEESPEKYDIDTVLIYNNDTGLAELNEAVNRFTEIGMTVMAVKKVPKDLKYRQLVRLNNGEAEGLVL